MTKLIKGLFIISLLLQANVLLADVFRSEDATGIISYSDQPSANSVLHSSNTAPYRYKHKVIHVYDGDTVKLENGEKVRLLGIDTPEVASHYRNAIAGGNAAKKWLSQQVKNTTVYIEYDQQQRDKYQRLLGYIFLENGDHINLMLVKRGLAIVNLFPPNLRYSNDLLDSQQQAKRQNLGMWAMKRYQLVAVDKVRKISGWKRYQGEVTAIKISRKYIRLIFNKKLSARISKENLHLFPEPERYIGKTVEVRGWLSGKKSPFSILVRHPSALIISTD